MQNKIKILSLWFKLKNMSNYILCNICKRFHYDNKPCLPFYRVFHEGYISENGMEFRAFSHEDAAEQYAAYYNDGGALIDDEIEIAVVNPRDREERKFIVSAYHTINYNIEEKTA